MINTKWGNISSFSENRSRFYVFSVVIMTLAAVLLLGSCDLIFPADEEEESPQLTGVSLSPETLTIDPEQVITFTVTAHFSDGSSETVNVSVDNWYTDNNTVLSVTGAGSFQALSNGGTVTVTVNYEGYTASATITVNESVPGGDDAFLLTINNPTVPDGTRLTWSGVFDSQANLVGVLPGNAAFDGGILESLVYAPQSGSLYTATYWEAEFTTGTYRLYAVIDMDGSGAPSSGDTGTYQEVTAASRIELTLDGEDFDPLVEESISITSSGLTSGSAVMAGYWLVPGTGMIENPVQVNEYLTQGTGNIPPDGLRGFCINFFELFDTETGGVTTNLNSFMIPGTYDLSIAIDSDGNSDMAEGDYLFYLENVSIDGSGTDITAALGSAEPLPPPRPTSLIPSPSDVSLALGETIEMGNYNGRIVLDNDNNTYWTFYEYREVLSWTSDNSSIASVDTTGLITAEGTGSTFITVSYDEYEGVTANIPVTVTEAEITMLSILPEAAEIVEGTTRQFTATAFYTDESEVDVTSAAVWSSDPSGIVTIDSDGLVSPVTTGSTTVTAEYEGFSDEAAVTVVPVILTEIVVTPADGTFYTGQQIQYTATGVYNDTSEITLTDLVTWSRYGGLTSDLSIDENGLALMRSASTDCQIRAVYDPGTGNVTGLTGVHIVPAYAFDGFIDTGPNPQGLDINGSGNIYVTVNSNNITTSMRVSIFNSSGGSEGTLASNGTGDGQVYKPADVAIGPSGNIFVTDYGGGDTIQRVQKFSSAGVFQTSWGGTGTGDGEFTYVSGIAVDGSGNVFVTDSSADRVQKFDNSGTFIGTWGTTGTANGQFDGPWGIAVDSGGNVYIADCNNDRIQKFDNSGTHLLTFGNDSSIEDGILIAPRDVEVDSEGNIFVTDLAQYTYMPTAVKKYNASGEYVTRFGYKWVTGTYGTFISPWGIAAASDGKMYVSDTATDKSQVIVFREADPIE